MNASVPRLHRARLTVAALIAAFALGAAAARACDTPVYRYAMYRWESAPYEVYHFHRGQPDAHFADVEEILAAAAAHEVAPANVAVTQVNLEDDPELKAIPRDVAKLFQAKTDAQLPLTLVVNPLGVEVYSGALEPAAIKSMIDSPLRQQLGKLLKQGNAAVFCLLAGKDAELNAAAEKALQKLVADVNSGKVQLYSGPDAVDPLSPKPQSPADGEKPQADEKPPHSISMLNSMLKLSREALEKDDPWLLRSLMAVEGDLAQFQDEPMVFVVYGRGRALPPFIGKGVTFDNLVEVTEFITSACSCTVKEQNPGVDLLMAFDWKAASAAVAERFGSEEGNQESLADLFPQLVGPKEPKEPAAIQDAGSSDVDAGGGTGSAGGSAETTPAPPAQTNAKPPVSDDPVAEAPIRSAPDDRVAVAADSTAAALDQSATPSAPGGPNLMATLGIGLVVALAALVAATFFILKPR